MPEYGGKVDDSIDTNYRILADHSRMFTSLICEGLRPGNEECEAMLRKVIRRCCWILTRELKAKEPLVCLDELSKVVCDILGGTYLELNDNIHLVKGVLIDEIERYYHMMAKVTEEIRKICGQQRGKSSKLVPGEAAFELFLRHGCPPELIEQVATSEGCKVDWTAFNISSEHHRRRTIEFQNLAQSSSSSSSISYSSSASPPSSPLTSTQENLSGTSQEIEKEKEIEKQKEIERRKKEEDKKLIGKIEPS